MNQNYIIVENVQEWQVKTALMDFANLYEDRNFINGIQLYRKKETHDSFLVLFTHRPHFDNFSYCVNYLQYPNIEKDYSPLIRGFFKVENIEENSKLIPGEWLMIYVSKNDEEYDQVFFVNEKNDSYLFDFGGAIQKLTIHEEAFEKQSIDINNYYHLTDIIPHNNASLITTKPWWKFW